MKLTQASELPWSEVSHNPAIQKQVFLKNGEISGLTQFARSVFQPGQVAPGHSHDDMTEVFLVTSGELTAEVDGTLHTLSAGSVLTLEPREWHELSNQGQEDLHLTYFGIITP